MASSSCSSPACTDMTNSAHTSAIECHKLRTREVSTISTTFSRVPPVQLTYFTLQSSYFATPAADHRFPARPVSFTLWDLVSDYPGELSAIGTRADRLLHDGCLLYTSPSPRDRQKSRMPSS